MEITLEAYNCTFKGGWMVKNEWSLRVGWWVSAIVHLRVGVENIRNYLKQYPFLNNVKIPLCMPCSKRIHKYFLRIKILRIKKTQFLKNCLCHTASGPVLQEQHSPQRRLAYQLPSSSLGYDLSERRLDEDTPVDTHEFDKYLKYQPELEQMTSSTQHQLDSNHNYQQQVTDLKSTNIILQLEKVPSLFYMFLLFNCSFSITIYPYRRWSIYSSYIHPFGVSVSLS